MRQWRNRSLSDISCGAVVLGVVGWLAGLGCIGGRSERSFGFDTGMTMPAEGVDTGLSGDVSITLALSRDDGAVDCAASGIASVRLEAGASVLTVACSDAPFVWYDAPAGGQLLVGTAETESGVLYTGSAPMTASEAVLLPLVCEENGVDGGCGG
jgi:hypothetical protein